MSPQTKSIAKLLLTVFTSCGVAHCQSQESLLFHVASSLTNHFETVVYSDSRFLQNFRGDNRHDESLNALRLPYVEMIADLTIMNNLAESDVEANYTSFIVGSKDFMTPSGLGVVLSHKCYVGIRADGPQPHLDSDFRNATYVSIAGLQTWTWSLGPYEGNAQSTSVYAAQVGSHYFVLANNREDFEAVAHALDTEDQMQHSSLNAFDQAGLVEHQYWAHRLIRRKDVSDVNAAALNSINEEVLSLSFFADISTRKGFIRVLTSDPTMRVRPRVLPDPELPRFQSQGPGIWDASIPLKQQDRANFEALTRLLGSFGIGIVL